MSPESQAAKRILVVDDEPDYAALLRSFLAREGYTVTTAHNCEDALSQVRKTKPDLITLDIHMPRKSGVFFYRKLKEDSRFQAIPVVIVSGLIRDDPEMARIVRNLLETEDVPHPEAYLEKPVERTELLAAVQAAISAGRS